MLSTNLARRHAVTVAGLFGLLLIMSTLVYYAVPLYRLFCQVTGFGGTTQVSTQAPAAAGERVITVRFNAHVNADLPWQFRPVQQEISLNVGEETLAFYEAVNESDRAITGSATFNVTPQKAGVYFSKIECFCFTEQRLEPGQRADMPVTFYIEPDIVDDPGLDDVNTITLSYTFFRREGERAATN